MEDLIHVLIAGYFMMGTLVLGIILGIASENPTIKIRVWLRFAAVFGWPVLFVLAWLQVRRGDQ